MRVAFCVEGNTDQFVFATLLTKLLGEAVEPDLFPFRRNGWNSAVEQAPKIAWHAYNKGLDGALFAIDNDGEPIHDDAHRPQENPGCRWCVLSERIPNKIAGQRRDGLSPIFFVVAVPVQTIEVWLLIARGNWREPSLGSRGRSGADRANLKRELYGVADPDGRTMRTAAESILTRADLDALADKSPSFAQFRKLALAGRMQLS